MFSDKFPGDADAAGSNPGTQKPEQHRGFQGSLAKRRGRWGGTHVPGCLDLHSACAAEAQSGEDVSLRSRHQSLHCITGNH